ncbi:CLUMA_CG017693, isoform A [Clunio marinus]|uniref:CLUMA_CG017693, isoform A n=1 Tax=Clunio marinus TaxID=568069 RepID=A0A1J1J192_9DIPT|nr:CLUMA_CG017693, isoform A [Clunio marinus]
MEIKAYQHGICQALKILNEKDISLEIMNNITFPHKWHHLQDSFTGSQNLKFEIIFVTEMRVMWGGGVNTYIDSGKTFPSCFVPYVCLFQSNMWREDTATKAAPNFPLIYNELTCLLFKALNVLHPSSSNLCSEVRFQFDQLEQWMFLEMMRNISFLESLEYKKMNEDYKWLVEASETGGT